jgi:rRNA-processing protein FCF1
MYYTRENHKRFLDKELTAISESYLKLLNTKAISLLASNDLYVSQYVKLDFKKNDIEADRNVLGSGQLMLRFKKDKGIPRKNEYFTAVILEKDMCLPKNWGDTTWGKLRSHQVEFSEVHCVWQGKTDDNGFLLCGFSGISLEMSQYLINNNLEGCVIVLGPQEPPMEYYQNLITIISNTSSDYPAKEILDFDKRNITWNPERINSNISQVDKIVTSLNSNNELVFQGPPGTGKTHLMAAIVARLITENKSVLVTALTNRALIELAQKDSLKEFLIQKKVKKTNVSADELISCKNICPVESKQITCMPGCVTLSTFYNASGWAKICYEEQPFDYVIMDEASQALFGMIAACKNLGKRIIWIGDQNQMQPIVLLSEETLVRNDYGMLANGFKTLCDNFECKSYILTESHRLLPNAASLTSIFYHTPIKSVAKFEYQIDVNKLTFAPQNGGCSLILTEMPIGEKADRSCCSYAIDIIAEILSCHPKFNISVLSKFRATVRMLQNCFVSRFGGLNNVLIDTVERVQGMTCDICLYYIPNTMMSMSLEKSLFNVATSRAKQLTIIISDKSIMTTTCDRTVATYLQKVSIGDFTPVPSQNSDNIENSIEAGEINLKIKGKIDLSQFETPKQKSVRSDSKRNIYIIDTNVFVNYPDIISKIDSKYSVVLSAKVIDELDKLKITLNSDGKRNVEKALRNINKSLDSSNVTMELSDSSLLPLDFNKKSPDNNILSVALKFKDENPILLTSDNGLQVKAKGLKISTISLKDFLKH